MHGILEGVKVLDFGRYIAGPWCAALLGDLGADVIRIEKRTGSEDRFIQPVATEDEGAIFLQCNRNKRGMTFNPRHARSGEVLARLVGGADVVIANMPPAGLKAAGLDYESLKQYREDIILTTVSAYGRGPWHERVGFDTVAQTMSGAAFMSGDGRAPVKSYAPWVDYGTAGLCAFGTLAALMERQRSGKGQVVEGALLATALTAMGAHLTEFAVSGKERKPIGNRSPYAGPADIVKVSDGWIAVQAMGQPLFTRLAKLIDREEWLEEPAYSNDTKRGKHGEALSAALGEWAADKTQTQALDLLSGAGVPCGPVYDLAQTMGDAHIKQAGFFKSLSLLHGGRQAPIIDTPVRFSQSAVGAKTRAPRLGEHTDEILAELDFSPEEIASLREEGVV